LPYRIGLAVGAILLVIVVAVVATRRTGDAQTSGSAQTTEATPTTEPGPPTDPNAPTLVWSDEFDGAAGSAPNTEYWTLETGGGGWGNDELQYYTDSTENAFLDGNGNLVISAKQVDPATTDLQCWYGACLFTSARLNTAQKQEFTFGRIEARVKMPAGSGLWPAAWMLGGNIGDVGWPQSGEIDIAEFVGRSPYQVFGTIHGPGYSGGQSFGGTRDSAEPVPDAWHVVAIDWSPGQIVWSIDGIEYHRADPASVAPNEWVFDHSFFLLANMAVGGNFGGAVGADAVFPAEYRIDYVRAYETPDGSG
jgi:beta-glucanase (GH16 family)